MIGVPFPQTVLLSHVHTGGAGGFFSPDPQLSPLFCGRDCSGQSVARGQITFPSCRFLPGYKLVKRFSFGSQQSTVPAEFPHVKPKPFKKSKSEQVAEPGLGERERKESKAPNPK